MAAWEHVPETTEYNLVVETKLGQALGDGSVGEGACLGSMRAPALTEKAGMAAAPSVLALRRQRPSGL